MITRYAQFGKYIPSWLYKILAQSWIDEKFPRHLFIETTADCNLTCPYCPRERRRDSMDFSLFKEIVKEASQYGPRSFSLHLFGEPLLYKSWFDAIRVIKSYNKRHTVLLTTNGTCLNEEADRVVASGVDKLIWSWRPEAKFTPETKEKLRKWGKFQVRILKQVTPKWAWEEWKDWRPIEIKDLHNYGGNIDLKKFSLRTSQDLSKTHIQGKFQHGVSNIKNGIRWPCYHLWLAPAVAWNGNILICCNDPHHKEVMGHFPEMSISEFWQGEKLKAIRQSHLEGKYKSICKNCDVWATYPQIHFKTQGNWWKKNVSSMEY